MASAAEPGAAPGAGDGENKGGAAPEAAGARAKAAPPPASTEAEFRQVAVVPLARRPLLPGVLMPVPVKDPKIIEAVKEARAHGQAYVGAFLRRSAAADALPPEAAAAAAAGDEAGEGPEAEGEAAARPAPDAGGDAVREEDLYDVGTFAQVHHVIPNDDGGAQLLLMGHRRLKKVGIMGEDPLRFLVQNLKDDEYDREDDVVKATSMEVISTIKDLLRLNPLHKEQMQYFAQHNQDLHDPSKLADLGATLSTAEEGRLQEVLEETDVVERLDQTLLLLKKELELSKLQADIGKRVEEKISENQRRYFLMEQLKSIKKELGMEKDDKSAVLEKFREAFEPVRELAPPEAVKVIEEEMRKLSNLETSSSEFNVTRNYLDWLTSLPWGQHSEEILDIERAQGVLDEDHHGLDDVKERILEFIAVARLAGSTQGKILCLSGPPGVGKTSIGKSIAKALNREYFRFSVGGLGDVAEIKGHRRTYVGAMPGKMVQCLKKTKTSNPLVLIDEIDKLGRGNTGDPASALLELLDPEQNGAFVDHYLDVPLDLSKVLFVCTANVVEAIPGPLLDRMEVIRLSGYIADEKKAIARNYLEPEARAGAGVPEDASVLTDGAVDALIDAYCREAGVRNLKKHLEKVFRKVALELVRREQRRAGGEEEEEEEEAEAEEEEGAGGAGEEEGAPAAGAAPEGEAPGAAGEPITISAETLPDYVGQPAFSNEKIWDATPTGVVMGLAWTAMGGSTLYIEGHVVHAAEGKGGIETTGQLGDVMRESARIAHSFARGFYEREVAPAREPAADAAPARFFEDARIHVHVPAGATPKDGPSAGVTMVTSLLSLALGRPVKPDLAMTGEVTLTGRVLPVGGIKEKTIAARRSGVTTVVFPEANRKDYLELDAKITEGLEAHFVDEYAEVFRLAFEGEGEA